MQRTEGSWARRLVALAIVGGIAGAALGFTVSLFVVPGYDASAFLLVTPAGDAPVQAGEVQYAQAISQVVTNPGVLAAAVDDTDLPDDPQQIRADPSPNAPLIEIVVNAEDARRAQQQAQATAEAVVAYTQERADLLGFGAVILAPAGEGVPAGLSLPAYLVAGAAMGAVLGALIAMLRGERHAAPAEAVAQPAQTVKDGTRSVIKTP